MEKRADFWLFNGAQETGSGEASMKAISLLTFVLLAIANSVAQEQPNLDTMLNDANYVLNHYEEMMTPTRCDFINVAKLATQCRKIAQATAPNIAAAKGALSRALKAKEPTLLDLFDISSELKDLSSNLDGFASELSEFSDQDGVPYAEAGVKAKLLAAHLDVVVRTRIMLACR